jgi:hypothetical protein
MLLLTVYFLIPKLFLCKYVKFLPFQLSSFAFKVLINDATLENVYFLLPSGEISSGLSYKVMSLRHSEINIIANSKCSTDVRVMIDMVTYTCRDQKAMILRNILIGKSLRQFSVSHRIVESLTFTFSIFRHVF